MELYSLGRRVREQRKPSADVIFVGKRKMMTAHLPAE